MSRISKLLKEGIEAVNEKGEITNMPFSDLEPDIGNCDFCGKKITNGGFWSADHKIIQVCTDHGCLHCLIALFWDAVFDKGYFMSSPQDSRFYKNNLEIHMGQIETAYWYKLFLEKLMKEKKGEKERKRKEKKKGEK